MSVVVDQCCLVVQHIKFGPLRFLLASTLGSYCAVPTVHLTPSLTAKEQHDFRFARWHYIAHMSTCECGARSHTQTLYVKSIQNIMLLTWH